MSTLWEGALEGLMLTLSPLAQTTADLVTEKEGLGLVESEAEIYGLSPLPISDLAVHCHVKSFSYLKSEV